MTFSCMFLSLNYIEKLNWAAKSYVILYTTKYFPANFPYTGRFCSPLTESYAIGLMYLIFSWGIPLRIYLKENFKRGNPPLGKSIFLNVSNAEKNGVGMVLLVFENIDFQGENHTFFNGDSQRCFLRA